jgi:hypothetical protein
MIYLVGGAGNGNFGDELIAKNWLDFLSAKNYCGGLIFDENSARISTQIFGGSFPSVNFTNDLSKLKWKGPKDFFGSLVRGVRFFENGGFDRHPDLRHLDALFSRVKVLHLHGGGYINIMWPHNAFLIGFAAAAKRRYGCRVVGTGLGILPVGDVPGQYVQLFRDTLEEFHVLELRDRWSYDYLRKFSNSPAILLGLDDTYLSPGSDGEPGSRPRTLHFSYFKSADLFEQVLDFAGSGRAGKFDRVLFWACTDGDKECFERLREVAPHVELISCEKLVRGPLPVGVGDYMITARFHPHLLAARLGANGVFRKDYGYYDVKHGSIRDLGSLFAEMGDGIEPDRHRGAFNAIHAYDAMRVAIKRRLASHIYADIM